MVLWHKSNELVIWFDSIPQTRTLPILPHYTTEDIKKVLKKPFVNMQNLKVKVLDRKNFKIYCYTINTSYKWNGADIPSIFWSLIKLSRTSVEINLASMNHDYILAHKNVVGYNRRVSSLIFRDICISCGLPKWKAYLISECVDIYQRFRKWK